MSSNWTFSCKLPTVTNFGSIYELLAKIGNLGEMKDERLKRKDERGVMKDE
jgi:hypothetical protein